MISIYGKMYDRKLVPNGYAEDYCRHCGVRIGWAKNRKELHKTICDRCMVEIIEEEDE